ncbi:MAG: histidine phosphatase family protein [Chloroflexi bacterium]|nr:histidine phosphatase family protein [Chloroflexota bacterium]
MEFLVVRHGQPVHAVENRHGGRADYPLTELGREQSRCAAAWIASYYQVDRIVSSPQKRAIETAHIIAQTCSLDVATDDALMEFDSGVLAGMLKSDAAVKYPKPEGGRRPHESLPGGESMIAFRARVQTVFSRLLSAAQPDQRTAIVAHGGTITMLFRAFLDLPMSDDVWLTTDETGMHLWRIDGAQRRIVFSNSLAHLKNNG